MQPFEDVRQIEPPADAHVFQHPAELAHILVGGFGFDIILDNALAPPFAVFDRVSMGEIGDRLVAHDLDELRDRTDAAIAPNP